jgi:hypothetical protein
VTGALSPADGDEHGRLSRTQQAPVADSPAIATDSLTHGAATAIESPGRPSFAHASEAEMARILDFYDVRWAYEPDTFPIKWNLDGDVVESFSPDFYLPDLDLYLEMTTLRQRLVRKKNRKLRRLRELYPDIRIKLFYARDFRALMLKYGRPALAESLSGTLGHLGRPRTAGLAIVDIDSAGTVSDSAGMAGIASDTARIRPVDAAGAIEAIDALALPPRRAAGRRSMRRARAASTERSTER